jgi:hypothetical protein
VVAHHPGSRWTRSCPEAVRWRSCLWPTAPPSPPTRFTRRCLWRVQLRTHLRDPCQAPTRSRLALRRHRGWSAPLTFSRLRSALSLPPCSAPPSGRRPCARRRGAQEEGPFVRDSITDSLLATEFFIATAVLTSRVLAAVTAKRPGPAGPWQSARPGSGRWPANMPRCAGWRRSSPQSPRCEMHPLAAYKGLRELHARGMVVTAGRHDRTHLWLPADPTTKRRAA